MLFWPNVFPSLGLVFICGLDKPYPGSSPETQKCVSRNWESKKFTASSTAQLCWRDPPAALSPAALIPATLSPAALPLMLV